MADGTDPVARLRAELGSLERAYSPGHHGLWAARRRAELIDAAVIELFRRAGAPGGVSLAAIGGYGRRAQLPRSDVDLLLLHDGAADVRSVADAVLYPLWDGGFEVGHAVRTVEECVAASDRLDAAAAMLDLRHLAGDEELSERAHSAVEALVRGDPAAFVRLIEADAARRRERFGSTAHLLEPDLKEGSGGWRDVHAVWLIERALARPLEEAGLLRGRERSALAAAEEFLARARSALHLETGRRTDRLVLDHQPAIARAMGFEDEPRLVAIDGLMRTLFEHSRQIEFVLGAVLGRFRAPDLGAVSAPASSAGVLEALAVEAEADREPPAALLDAIEEAAVVPDEVAWDGAVRTGFTRLLRAGERGAASLELLDRLELLGRYLPEWRDVRCRPQRDPYHRSTVDAHLTHTLRAMGRLLTGAGAEDDPVQREAVKQVAHPDALLLGALLHDIGKTGEGSHVAVGARLVEQVLGRIGVDGEAGELVRTMVVHHLLLPDTATRRDLSDENLVLDVAAAVGSAERLAALYLLAKADAEATGPAAWTPWRRTLIWELVAKVQHVLERGEMGAELAGRLGDRVDRLRELLAAEPPGDVEVFLRRMPRAYLLAVEPERAARHFGTIVPPVGAREARAVHLDGVRPGTYELLVVAQDRGGLLSWIAGALALAGLSVLAAQVFTTDDGVAVDLFEVEGAWEPDVPEDRWRAFRSTLRRAIEGTVSLERGVQEQRRWYASSAADVPVTVAVQDDASDFATVIEVGASDRLGLLYDITRTFADHDVDVHVAKVATYDGRVVDAFYVRDELGRKLDATASAEVAAALRTRVG